MPPDGTDGAHICAICPHDSLRSQAVPRPRAAPSPSRQDGRPVLGAPFVGSCERHSLPGPCGGAFAWCGLMTLQAISHAILESCARNACLSCHGAHSHVNRHVTRGQLLTHSRELNSGVTQLMSTGSEYTVSRAASCRTGCFRDTFCNDLRTAKRLVRPVTTSPAAALRRSVSFPHCAHRTNWLRHTVAMAPLFPP